MDRWRRSIQQKADHDQVFSPTGTFLGEDSEGQIMSALVEQEDPRQQHQSTGSMHQQVAVAGLNRTLLFTVPDQKGGGKSHQFPEDKQGEIIAGQGHSQGTGNIKERSNVLSGLLDLQTENATDQGHQGEHMEEDKGELVNPPELQLKAKVIDDAEAVGQAINGRHGDQRHNDQPDFLNTETLGKGHQQCA